ncbi:CoA-binding protein [Paenibacillus pasadenensis]|uniref:Succinyl-CoA synthetase, alpha subunit-related enzyme n=1 Tax=Paenibacillus pasadenensis TaxID=217090 RepID=A0A2N5N7U8_9BACL|nr:MULTISPECIES: CoA-binding protein [Paenibacillus]PLT46380.1 Succinyl-CoA synthetase, alpha subunit-related enzyme [Paenibacillus pasadenensis]QGG58790.1 CoA-binding protein [Paenibacillus sp. B01]
MPFANPEREQIKSLLEAHTTVAVVGLSDKPDRTSHAVSQAMQQRGYRIIPVNPAVQGDILGERCYPDLASVPEPIGIVNVFRRSEFTPDIAREAVAAGAKVLWLQLGVYSEEAAEIARQGGLDVVMDRCIKVEDSILQPRIR